MAQEASLPQIKAYFGCPGRPVEAKEMTDFWKSLTDEQKTFYKVGVGEILAAQG